MEKQAFFDVDYTLYDGYLTTNFNHFLVHSGYAHDCPSEPVGKLEAEFAAGTIGYEEASKRVTALTANLLRDQKVSTVQAWQDAFATEHTYIYPWVASVFELLKSRGFEITLISAAVQPALESIAKALNASAWHSTQLEIVDGVYSGRALELLNYQAKHTLLKTLINNNAFSLGMGDSSGDIDMLGGVTYPILYNPKTPELRQLAETKQWPIATGETVFEMIKGKIESL